MDGSEEDGSSPIPIPRGTYNFDFDSLDENVNPFQSKSKMSNSPTNAVENPFVTKNKLGISPPTVENNNDIKPMKSEKATSNQGMKKPKARSPESEGEVLNVPTGEDNSSSVESSEKMDTSKSSPETEEVKFKPKEKKNTSGKVTQKKGIKKPKKFKPPPNFGFQGGSNDEIQIFAPPSDPSSDVNHSEETNTPDIVPLTQAANDNESANDYPSSHDLEGANQMAQSLEMVHDFGAGEMPEEENEGFAPAHEEFEDAAAWEMLDKYGSEEKCVHEPSPEEDSLYSKFDPLYEGKDGRGGTQHEEHLADESDNLLLMSTPPPKSTSRVPKHPAARALEEKVEEENGSPAQSQVDRMLSVTPNKDNKTYSSGDEVEEGKYYDAYEYPPNSKESWVKKNDSNGDINKGSMENNIVQLVQVLKYSQSDWNKMKQDLELDFQAKLLNKEREWSRKLGDREKQISQLTESNKTYKQANEDMRCVVADFEKTIHQLQADKERVHSESQQSYEDVVRERDQSVEDLQGVEASFADLHRRYEKLKGVLEGFKKNEEVLKKCIQDYQSKLKKSEEKLQNIKEQAEDKLEQASIEMQALRKSTTAEMARLEAAAKKSDLQVQGLHKSLEQKVQENKELTAICDELIAKVGVD